MHRAERKGEWTMECHVTCSCGVVFTSLVPLSAKLSTRSTITICTIVPLLLILITITLALICVKRRNKRFVPSITPRNLLTDSSTSTPSPKSTPPSSSSSTSSHIPAPKHRQTTIPSKPPNRQKPSPVKKTKRTRKTKTKVRAKSKMLKMKKTKLLRPRAKRPSVLSRRPIPPKR